MFDEFGEPDDQRAKAGFWHVGDQGVEQAALAEQGMGSVLGGVRLEVTVHAEAFARGAEQRQKGDREGIEPVHRVGFESPDFFLTFGCLQKSASLPDARRF